MFIKKAFRDLTVDSKSWFLWPMSCNRADLEEYRIKTEKNVNSHNSKKLSFKDSASELSKFLTSLEADC